VLHYSTQATQKMHERRAQQQRDEQESAAVMIQSQFRGLKARRRVTLLREERAQDPTLGMSLDQKIEYEVELHNKEVEAATVVQAAFRGWKVRDVSAPAAPL
jgi:hypothetical protein